jgi:hypothetical protein
LTKPIKCESCGKEGMDEKLDYCYGCGHIVCTDCSKGVSGNHKLEDHKKVFLGKPDITLKPEGKDMTTIQVTQSQRQIYIIIITKDPLEALDIAHTIMFQSQTFKTCKAHYKLMPP